MHSWGTCCVVCLQHDRLLIGIDRQLSSAFKRSNAPTPDEERRLTPRRAWESHGHDMPRRQVRQLGKTDQAGGRAHPTC